MMRMSQWIFWARSLSVEVVVGRIIHRITRDTTTGFSWAVESVERKFGIVVEAVRDSKWRVQRGISEVCHKKLGY